MVRASEASLSRSPPAPAAPARCAAGAARGLGALNAALDAAPRAGGGAQQIGLLAVEQPLHGEIAVAREAADLFRG